MNSSLTTSKDWQRQRAIALHNAFTAAERRLQVEGLTLKQILSQLLATLRGTVIACRPGALTGRALTGRAVKQLRISRGSLKANWYRWKKNGRTPESLLLDYNCGSRAAHCLPTELVAEIQRRATMPGLAHFSVVYTSIVKDWKAGKPIPGLGIAPHGSEFPFSKWSFYDHQPNRRERALGNKGFAALKQNAPHISLNYSNLRKCELFVLDDVRLDVLCIDENTGQPVEVRCYFMMEAGSRYIVAYILKPEQHIRQEDVDELIAYGLQTTGLGRDYTTHIKLERGTVAMSVAAQTLLEAATHGKLKIHRTGMDGGLRWIGSHKDRASGHWMGKAVIESFFRKLHLALMTLPGQRGNKHENQPANLGMESVTKITPGSLLDEASKLAQFQLSLNAASERGLQAASNVRQSETSPRLKLKLPMLYLFQLDAAVRAAIKNHNTEPGHGYQGHGFYREAEAAPGLWQKLDVGPVPSPGETDVGPVPSPGETDQGNTDK